MTITSVSVSTSWRRQSTFIFAAIHSIFIIFYYVSSFNYGQRNATVSCLFVCLSVCPIFSDDNAVMINLQWRKFTQCTFRSCCPRAGTLVCTVIFSVRRAYDEVWQTSEWLRYHCSKPETGTN